MRYMIVSLILMSASYSSTINFDSITQYLNSQKSFEQSLVMTYNNGKWINPFKNINSKVKEIVKYDELKRTYTNISNNLETTGTNLWFKINLKF